MWQDQVILINIFNQQYTPRSNFVLPLLTNFAGIHKISTYMYIIAEGNECHFDGLIKLICTHHLLILHHLYSTWWEHYTPTLMRFQYSPQLRGLGLRYVTPWHCNLWAESPQRSCSKTSCEWDFLRMLCSYETCTSPSLSPLDDMNSSKLLGYSHWFE